MSLQVDVQHRLGDFQLETRFETEGRLIALFGASGSGKTSLVNIIAGLIRPARGQVTVDGSVLVDTARGLFVPKHKRRVGYVFQEGRLFPHLTVRQNLLYGRWFTPTADRRANLEETVDLLGIEALLDRRPDLLSGGEKQRVAIGRALLASPRLLLMDEPLASLDEARKRDILPYLERLRDRLGIPIVYVSHALSEVARLATTVVLLDKGKVAALGPVDEVTSRLDLLSIAGGSDAGSVLAARVARQDTAFDLTVLDCPAGEITVPHLTLPIGAEVRVRIRASDVLIGVRPPEGLSALNVLTGTIEGVLPAGPSAVTLRVDCHGQGVLARVTRKSADALDLKPGRPVHAILKTVAIDAASMGGD